MCGPTKQKDPILADRVFLFSSNFGLRTSIFALPSLSDALTRDGDFVIRRD